MRRTRLAYLVLAHHKPEQLRWLFEALYDPQDLFLIHVDLKSVLGLRRAGRHVLATARALAAGRPNVRFLRPRMTNWGGWSLSQVQLDAIGAALRVSGDWTHFLNVSGQCYPIKPTGEMRRQLAEADDQVFVEMRPFSSLPPDDWHLRWYPMVELPHKAYWRRGPRRPPADFALDHKGSQWSILPRAFCEWQRTAPVARRIRRYLRGLLLSDELIMQTLVRNGPWRDKVAPHFGREVVWPGPKVLTLADWPRLMASPAFLARKFDDAVDDRVVPELARALGLRTPLGLPSAPAGGAVPA